MLTACRIGRPCRDAADRIRRAFAEPLVDGDKSSSAAPRTGSRAVPRRWRDVAGAAGKRARRAGRRTPVATTTARWCSARARCSFRSSISRTSRRSCAGHWSTASSRFATSRCWRCSHASAFVRSTHPLAAPGRSARWCRSSSCTLPSIRHSATKSTNGRFATRVRGYAELVARAGGPDTRRRQPRSPHARAAEPRGQTRCLRQRRRRRDRIRSM